MNPKYGYSIIDVIEIKTVKKPYSPITLVTGNFGTLHAHCPTRTLPIYLKFRMDIVNNPEIIHMPPKTHLEPIKRNTSNTIFYFVY